MITKLQLKQHPIALSFLGIYFLCWIYLGFIALNEFTHYGDGETIGMCLYFFFPFICLPYFILTGLKAMNSKHESSFYWRLVWLILVPLPIAVLVGLGIHLFL